MPHATIDPDLLINDDEVRNSVMRLHRERNAKRMLVLVIMLAALVAGVVFTDLSYLPA
jgi:hypothetical protein